jgi:hypothetical protein
MNNEPVAWMCQDNVTDEWEFSSMKHCHKCEPLYTHPAELTDEEINELYVDYQNPDYYSREVIFDQLGFARAILRKASEK